MSEKFNAITIAVLPERDGRIQEYKVMRASSKRKQQMIGIVNKKKENRRKWEIQTTRYQKSPKKEQKKDRKDFPLRQGKEKQTARETSKIS